MIEGPISHDVDFAISWLEAARKAGSLWHDYALENPEADECGISCARSTPLYEHSNTDLTLFW